MNWILRGAAVLAVVVLAGPARAAEADKMLPADSNLVLSVNLQQTLAAPVIKKYALDKVKDFLKADDESQKVLKELGIDPLTDFTRVTLAMSASAGPDKPLLIVKGKFDAKKIADKAAEYAKAHADRLAVVKEGSDTLFEIKGGPAAMFACVVNDTTLVAAGTKDLVVSALAQGRGEKKVTLDKELAELIKAADDQQSLWIAALTSVVDKLPIPDPNFKKAVESLSAMSGLISVTADLKIEIGLVTKDADAAKALSAQVEQGLEQAKSLLPVLLGAQEELKPVIDLVNSMKAAAKGKAVVIKGNLTAEYLEKAFKGG